jgi:hypothetical protein
MSTIYTRASKGSALTWTEGDANITNLNTDKLENIVADTTPQLGGNLDVNGNSIVSTSNANIEIAPNGTGDVYLTADLVRVGDSNANATITTNGTGDLILSTNGGSNSGVITIQDGLDNDITVVPAGTGKVHFETSETRVGINNTNAKITTKGTGDLTLDTNSGTNSGSIVIADGVNGNITLTPNGTGAVVIDGLSYPQADGTANQVLKTNGSGVLSFVTPAAAFDPASPGAIGGTTKAAGTFTTMTADTAVLDDIRETVAALTYGATITPDAADGSIRTITLTGNVTFSAFSNPVSGQTITLIITQDGTGSRTLTSTMKFSGASKTLSTAAASIDILTVSYIGTTYYASLSKGFA